ncbi:MAG TPA: hypothetical protein VMA73_09105 [Streptosporangiaceae bacterium]|nr:hypothetical protein [Streptosporangiaceae bacterium]
MPTLSRMMKVLRAIGQWLGKVMTEGGPPPTAGCGVERVREDSRIDTYIYYRERR